MSQPKLFLGSSKKNIRVARVLADTLDSVAEVTVWDEGVFDMNRGFLETLLAKLEEFDFAAFILAPDDVTSSGDGSKPSPRDNVLFESGLFMGVLGRDRVFLICDQDVELKIPSDLAGVTLASYDGSRIDGDDAEAAVRKASRLISDKIKASRFPYLLGLWRSQYPLTFEEGSPLALEDIEVRSRGEGLSFVTKANSLNDFYTATARMLTERQVVGKWKSKEEDNDMEGVFVLTVNAAGNLMYGYFTSPDFSGGTVYGSWVLTKIADADEAKISQRLERGRTLLISTTILDQGGKSGSSPAAGN